MNQTDLTIIIPALNESAIIIENVDEVADWIKNEFSHVSYEVIVVNDGSTDGMGELLEEASKDRCWLKVIHHAVNMGRGRGVRTGFEASNGNYIICLDADLSYAPAHISALLKPLLEEKADITLASAHHPEGNIINVPAQREFLSKWGNWILGLGLGGKFSTVTCIVRGFTREVAEALELVSDGKELHLEIIQKAQLMGYRIVEIPATLEWRDRKRGRSVNRRLFPEIAIFKMRKTVISHLIFNYISNPGILLLLPLLALLLIIVSGTGMLFVSFFDHLGSSNLTLMQVMRQTLLDGQLTLVVVSFAFIFFMIFMGFYFLSFQSKRYFDETYTLMMRMNLRIKHIETKTQILEKDG